jgi:ribosomal protein L11 methyltransferase
MPYRVDFQGDADTVLERLVELGALDVEASTAGIAALMPDSVKPGDVASALGIADVSVSPAVGRDAQSVWVLRPRAIRVGRIDIRPAGGGPSGGLQLIDSRAFGSGLHPTTALCLEALDEVVSTAWPASVLDVGTGSGVLALAALTLGVPRATGIDIDADALRAAAANARINGLEDRLQLRPGGPEAVAGTWPLVLANVLAAPLIEMAPALVRRIGHHGRLVLSGIPSSVEPDVDAAYRHLGMRRIESKSRDGWIGVVMQATW